MRGFYSLVPLCPRAVCPLEKLGFDKWPLKEKSGGDYWVSLVSGVSSCVCTVSSGWQGHWYSLRTSAEAFLGPPATALNLVLILGAWWSCLFWWAASRVRRNALCWTEGCWAVNTPHTCMRTSKKKKSNTHTHWSSRPKNNSSWVKGQPMICEFEQEWWHGGEIFSTGWTFYADFIYTVV